MTSIHISSSMIFSAFITGNQPSLYTMKIPLTVQSQWNTGLRYTVFKFLDWRDSDLLTHFVYSTEACLLP